jgi:dihydroxyacetone kinase-like protein
MTETISVEQLVSWMETFRNRILNERDYLTELDAKIGDADHGANMVRGVNAIVDRLQVEHPATVAEFGKLVGMALISTVGGAAGPLYGTFFLRAGTAGADRTALDSGALIAVLEAGVNGVQARGNAQLGDKTMYDVLDPALEAARQAQGQPILDGLAATVTAARNGLNKSKQLIAKRGRARYLGQRSAGHVDPGAASSVMLLESLLETLTEK